ncbi:MAG TPA: cupin domain-containing protein [Candidatus Saccharimonas sp.]|nr:cupin domain-containing protein [Candidatus Saccharimonas sp.]
MNHLKDAIQQAKTNDYFRRVLATSRHIQIVIMSIPSGGEIGEEVHPDNDQTLLLVEGAGEVVLDGVSADFNTGDIVVVPAGTRHNFVTKGESAMKIITAYAPPHHPEGTIHKTKAEADRAG